MTMNQGKAHLDSHANMVVLRRICCIISKTERYTLVTGLNNGTVDKVPIVDAIICHNVPNSDQ